MMWFADTVPEQELLALSARHAAIQRLGDAGSRRQPD